MISEFSSGVLRRHGALCALMLAGCAPNGLGGLTSDGINGIAQTKLTIDGEVLVEADGVTEIAVGEAHTFHFVLTPIGVALPAGTALEIVVPATFDAPQAGDPTVPGYTTAGRFDANTWYLHGDSAADGAEPDGTEPDGTASPDAESAEEDVEVTIYLEDDDITDGADAAIHGTEPWVARVELATDLGADEVLEVAYGETTGGAIGARSSFLARDNFAFDLRMDLDGDGAFTGVASYQIATIAGPPAVIRVYPASSGVAGAAVPVRAALFDGLGNATTGVAEDLACYWHRGDGDSASQAHSLGGPGSSSALLSVTAPDAAGAWWLQCTHPTVPVVAAGITFVEEAPAPSGDGSVAPPTIGATTGAHLLWGDLHVHSTVSDDAAMYSQSPAGCYSYARNSSGLDFASVSDHDRNGIDTQTAFETDEIAAANDAYAPGSFVSILSYEWTDNDPGSTGTEGGHKIVYYHQGDGTYYCESATDPDPRCVGGAVPKLYSNLSTSTDSTCELWSSLANDAATTVPAVSAFTIPHHVATNGSPPRTAWTTVPADCGGAVTQRIQPIVELFSEHGSGEGWNGAQGATIEDPLGCAADLTRTVQEAQEYRWGAAGTKSSLLGVIGASDAHSGRPGTDSIPQLDTTAQGNYGVGVKCNSSLNYRWREAGLSALWVDAADLTDAHDRSKIYTSLQQRRTYATSGSRITLSYFLKDITSVGTTILDQGGFPLSGSLNQDDPEYDITTATDHNTSLELENICPGSVGAALESVVVIRGTGQPGNPGSWAWNAVATYTSFDAATGCLLNQSVPLISAGVRQSSALAIGKNQYYVKVKEVPRAPVGITADRNLLRVGTSLTSLKNCALTTGEWAAPAYAARLQSDLNAPSCGGLMGRTFTVTYDNIGNGNFASDFRLKVTANANFAMDNANTSIPEVELTASAIGFARADKSGAKTYTTDDQVQNLFNSEFAWSSPVWIDYTGL